MQTQVYSIDEIREIVAPIAKQHGVDKVFLFGSYARGDATPASDVDPCVDAPKLRSVCPRRSVCRPGRRAQKEHRRCHDRLSQVQQRRSLPRKSAKGSGAAV